MVYSCVNVKCCCDNIWNQMLELWKLNKSAPNVDSENQNTNNKMIFLALW